MRWCLPGWTLAGVIGLDVGRWSVVELVGWMVGWSVVLVRVVRMEEVRVFVFFGYCEGRGGRGV